jgi:hypothetical protein
MLISSQAARVPTKLRVKPLQNFAHSNREERPRKRLTKVTCVFNEDAIKIAQQGEPAAEASSGALENDSGIASAAAALS